ncbi:hypothetical protein QBC43DRAFT_202884 [Cladorrhinum sp. PSN259]|nr:hypothetical protein QBC43DRAFT_202884 [Cladorrhinum sp. PSN259]
MADAGQHQQQVDSDSGTPQRKRIAVACGRCRKRKIRCSGDPGGGQPCTNCKNAGAEPCQFLRVASREAPFRTDAPDFGYSVGDARLYASRATAGMGYVPELSHLEYRGAPGPFSSHAYTPAPKAGYYAYPSPYVGEPYEQYDHGGIPPVPSQSVLNPDTEVGMTMSHQGWPVSSAGARTKQPAPPPPPPPPPAFGSIYTMDNTTDPRPYSPYSNHGSSFPSFSNVAASLPASSPVDRLLPNPTGTRSSTLPYPVTGAGSTTSASSLADVTTASYGASGFDATSAYSSSSRGNGPDPYQVSNQPESLFSPETRDTLSSNGPGYPHADFGATATYTSSDSRRDSGPVSNNNGGGGSSNSSSTGNSSSSAAAYAPAESAHEATPHGVTTHHHHHHHHQLSHAAGGASHSVNGTVTGGTAASSHSSYPGHGQGHVESRQRAVSSRH